MATIKELAERYLRQRYEEQADMFPTMLDDIPLSLYLAVNVPTMLRSAYWRKRLVDCQGEYTAPPSRP